MAADATDPGYPEVTTAVEGPELAVLATAVSVSKERETSVSSLMLHLSLSSSSSARSSSEMGTWVIVSLMMPSIRFLAYAFTGSGA